MPDQVRHDGQRLSVFLNFEQSIHADPARVFDLLCPVKEGEWLDGWDYTLLHSESGLAPGKFRSRHEILGSVHELLSGDRKKIEAAVISDDFKLGHGL